MIDQGISLPHPKKQRNHFPWCWTETGTKWLHQTGNSWMHWWAWHHRQSHSICHLLLKYPNYILITDEVVTLCNSWWNTEVRVQEEKVAPQRSEIMVWVLLVTVGLQHSGLLLVPTVLAESRCAFALSSVYWLTIPSAPLWEIHIHLQLLWLCKWKTTANEHREDIYFLVMTKGLTLLSVLL